MAGAHPLSLGATTTGASSKVTEALAPRACALQERPLQWKACAPTKVAPACQELEKTHSRQRPIAAKNK